MTDMFESEIQEAQSFDNPLGQRSKSNGANGTHSVGAASGPKLKFGRHKSAAATGGDQAFRYAEVHFEETKRAAGCLFVPTSRFKDPLGVLNAMIMCFEPKKPHQIFSVAGQRYQPPGAGFEMDQNSLSEATSYLEWFQAIKEDRNMLRAWGLNKKKFGCFGGGGEDCEGVHQYAETMVDFSSTICQALFDRRIACASRASISQAFLASMIHAAGLYAC
jgi:hypothetical protein